MIFALRRTEVSEQFHSFGGVVAENEFIGPPAIHRFRCAKRERAEDDRIFEALAAVDGEQLDGVVVAFESL